MRPTGSPMHLTPLPGASTTIARWGVMDMQGSDRKAAIAAYKEQKAAAGIYAVRCAPSGQCWVGRAPNLSTIQNRIWFGLRQGGDPHRSLQAAWKEHGPEAFTFEVVERLEDEDSAYIRDKTLKERFDHWVKELGAEAL
jgi:hypothetical protein